MPKYPQPGSMAEPFTLFTSDPHMISGETPVPCVLWSFSEACSIQQEFTSDTDGLLPALFSQRRDVITLNVS